MNKHRIFNIGLAVAVIAAWMVIAGMLDKQLMEGDARHNSDTQVEQRRNQAAMQICGNAHATWQDATTLVCKRHNGRGKSVITTGVTL